MIAENAMAEKDKNQKIKNKTRKDNDKRKKLIGDWAVKREGVADVQR